MRELLRTYKCWRLIGLTPKQLIRLSSELIQRDDTDWGPLAGGMVKNVAFTRGGITISVTPDSYFETRNVTVYREIEPTLWEEVFNTAYPSFKFQPGEWTVLLRDLYKATMK